MRKMITAAIAVACVGALAAPATAAPDPDQWHGYCGKTPFLFVGSNSGDRLVGTDCPDVILGLDGNDRIRGRFGADALRGGRGNDRISDPSSVGVINGGSGFDICRIRAGSGITVRRCERIVVV